MADNVTAPTSDGGGPVFATDLVGGAHYPYSKVAFGADNTATIVDSSTGLPVSHVGNVTVVGTGTLAVQAAATLSAETTKVIGTVNISAAQTVGLAAGSAVIGHVILDSGTTAATQSGTWTVGLSAAQTLATVTTLGTITNVVHVDDNSGSLTVDNGGTFAVQSAQSGTWTVQPGNTANTTAWKVDASSVAVPVTDNSGSLTVDNNGTFAVQASIASAQTLATVTTVSTVTNLSQLGGVAIAMNTGTRSTGTQRVTIATDDLVPVSIASVPSHAVTNAGTFVVQDNPQTSSGFLVSRAIDLSIANQGSTVAKNSAGQVYGWAIFNTNAAACYVKLYNKATGPTSADTPVVTLLIPGNTAGGGLVTQLNKGIAFSSGISYRATTAIADNSAAAVAASEVSINLFYF